MRKVNDLRNIAKREYLLIRVLEITLVGLLIFLLVYFINAILNVRLPVMAAIEEAYFPMYELSFAIIGLAVGTIFWRLYRIPPDIQTTLESYYKDYGYSTKKTLFHNLKVFKSPDLYFNVKIHLHRRASGENCLFHLESMPIPAVLQNKERFKMIGEQFFLQSNIARQKYSTTCELEEVHLRSLLMTQALEMFIQTRN